MKAHYQSYCYGVELCKAEGQSIVECRMASGDVGGIVDVEARAALLQASCESGEVKYGGKLFLTVLYTDSEGKLCRAGEVGKVCGAEVKFVIAYGCRVVAHRVHKLNFHFALEDVVIE